MPSRLVGLSFPLRENVIRTGIPPVQNSVGKTTMGRESSLISNGLTMVLRLMPFKGMRLGFGVTPRHFPFILAVATHGDYDCLTRPGTCRPCETKMDCTHGPAHIGSDQLRLLLKPPLQNTRCILNRMIRLCLADEHNEGSHGSPWFTSFRAKVFIFRVV
jgi:hypothetical protein